MYNDSSFSMWIIFAFMILICELYVPYKKRIFLSMVIGAFSVSAFSCVFSDLFEECVFFITDSVFVYSLSVCLSLFKMKHTSLCRTIALCDICENSFGRVYCRGKSYVIKNQTGKKIMKGEVVNLQKHCLEGESLVPGRI